MLASDLGKIRQVQATLEGIAHHRRQTGSESAALYCELMSQYWQRILEAHEQGEFIAGHSVLVPPEIFYAMGIVPYHLECVITASMIVLKEQESFLAAAKAFGLTPEVCSTHRAIAAAFTQGWLPSPNVVVWNNEVCDNTAKSNELVREHCQIPGFYFDCPYRCSEVSISYLAAKFAELVRFLEEESGRKMDWERLVEALRLSRRMVELQREINELRKATPSPGSNRLGSQLLYTGFYWIGTPQGVRFYETVRDELKEQVKRGGGAEERYRLLSLFAPMGYNWKLLDWMKGEHGATIVAEPYCSYWGEMDWDFSEPLLTLARRTYAHPECRTMNGPVEEGLVQAAVEDALAYQVDGAIYWAHIGCRQACAVIRILKDALRERVDIPTLTLEMDNCDPSFVSEEEMRTRLEGFFEMLDERK